MNILFSCVKKYFAHTQVYTKVRVMLSTGKHITPVHCCVGLLEGRSHLWLLLQHFKLRVIFVAEYAFRHNYECNLIQNITKQNKKRVGEGCQCQRLPNVKTQKLKGKEEP